MPLPPQFRIIPWSPPAVKSKFSSVLMQNSKFHLNIPGPKLPLVVPVPCGTGSGVHLARPTRRMAQRALPAQSLPFGGKVPRRMPRRMRPSFSRPSRSRRICQRCSALHGDGKDTHPTVRSASSRLYFSPPGNFFPLPPSNRVKDGRVSRHYGAVPHRPLSKKTRRGSL